MSYGDLSPTDYAVFEYEKDQEIKRLTRAIRALESDLQKQADDLLAYRDYYGTSPAQVRHLSTCVGGCCPRDCSGDDYSHDRCPDYPTE